MNSVLQTHTIMMTSSNGKNFRVTDFCAGYSPVTGEFPAQMPVTRSFDIFFDFAWTNSWANKGDAVDLRRYRVYYDVIVMSEVLPDDNHDFPGYLINAHDYCIDLIQGRGV